MFLKKAQAAKMAELPQLNQNIRVSSDKKINFLSAKALAFDFLCHKNNHKR